MHLEEEQFQLPLSVKKSRPPRRWALVKGERSEHSLSERVAGIDQVLSTRDIERITGRHRCTLYRWVRAGTFPPKRAGGGRGWLRSDIERWLKGGGASGKA